MKLFTDEFKFPRALVKIQELVFLFTMVWKTIVFFWWGNWHYKRPCVIGTAASYRSYGIIFPPAFDRTVGKISNSPYSGNDAIHRFATFFLPGHSQTHMDTTI